MSDLSLVELGQEVLSREYKRHQEPQALHGLLLSPKKVGSARLFEEGVGLSHKHLPNRHGINKTEHNSRDFYHSSLSQGKNVSLQ